jgi:beta-lactam-binding protein with PASTA domain
MVAKITPEPGTSADTSSKVTVYVSRDLTAEKKPVPDVLSWQLEMAKTFITASGFQVGIIDNKPSSMPQGTVIDQSPAGKDMQPEGTSINLVISTGVPESSSVNLQIKLPNLGATEMKTLSVFVNNELNSQKTVLMNGGNHTLSLSGSASATGEPYEFVVIIDNQTFCTGKVNFGKTPAEITERLDTEFVKEDVGQTGNIITNVVGKTRENAKIILELEGFTNITLDYQGKAESDSSSWIVESQTPNDYSEIIPYNTPITLLLKPAEQL